LLIRCALALVPLLTKLSSALNSVKTGIVQPRNVIAAKRHGIGLLGFQYSIELSLDNFKKKRLQARVPILSVCAFRDEFLRSTSSVRQMGASEAWKVAALLIVLIGTCATYFLSDAWTSGGSFLGWLPDYPYSNKLCNAMSVGEKKSCEAAMRTIVTAINVKCAGPVHDYWLCEELRSDDSTIKCTLQNHGLAACSEVVALPVLRAHGFTDEALLAAGAVSQATLDKASATPTITVDGS
jgi:hypothetical protein